MSLIEVSTGQLERLIRRVQSASREDLHSLLDAIGQQQEDAARQRILQTKRAPDGTAWKPWSDSYRKQQKGKKGSLLRQTGALSQSMDHQVGSDSVEVGSNMVYAGTHLFSYGKIPARAYLDTQPGFEDPRDRAEISDMVGEFLGELLQ